MTEQRNQLADLFAACWKDEVLKARFMADPKTVLAEYNMSVPDGMDVKVVENADNCVHITYLHRPAAPGNSLMKNCATQRGVAPLQMHALHCPTHLINLWKSDDLRVVLGGGR